MCRLSIPLDATIPASIEPGTAHRGAGNIDITDRCRPLGTKPLDHNSYVRHCLAQVGAMSISADITDVTASYTGAWPHGHVEVSFRHADYSGLTLIARCSIYDENGQRVESAPRYIADRLAEQAAMRSYPPAEHAVDGVLWV